MNILTFDIEEWYSQKYFLGNHLEMYQGYDKCLGNVLDLLDELQYKGTFFCVGMMGKDFPNVVRRIAEHGHEIGCHSHRHKWLNKMSKDEVVEDTRTAIDALEQCVGQKVKSYRAPAFSIGEDNKWVFEVLAECGIERDASVFPTTRELGGFPQFKKHVPTLVSYQGVTLREFPIPTTKVFGKEVAYSGGGFFRLFPLRFVKSSMTRSDYNMCYFHIDDINPAKMPFLSKELYESYFKKSGTLLNRSLRYFKNNVGKSSTFEKMKQILYIQSFCSIQDADDMMDWNNASICYL